MVLPIALVAAAIASFGGTGTAVYYHTEVSPNWGLSMAMLEAPEQPPKFDKPLKQVSKHVVQASLTHESNSS